MEDRWIAAQHSSTKWVASTCCRQSTATKLTSGTRLLAPVKNTTSQNLWPRINSNHELFKTAQKFEKTARSADFNSFWKDLIDQKYRQKKPEMPTPTRY